MARDMPLGLRAEGQEGQSPAHARNVTCKGPGVGMLLRKNTAAPGLPKNGYLHVRVH